MNVDYAKFKELDVAFDAPGVLHVQFNRPQSHNIITPPVWKEYGAVFRAAAEDPNVRVILTSGKGRHLAAGINLENLRDLYDKSIEEHARRIISMQHFIREFQHDLKSVYDCGKPTIAVAHGASIGLTMDLLSQYDIRFGSKDARFAIREALVGIAADVGSLQQFPRIVSNQSWVREVVYTGRDFMADEALAHGFLGRVFDTKEDAVAAALELAKGIAASSPMATHGIKDSMNYSRDHSLDEGLRHIAHYAAYALGPEILKGIDAVTNKKPAAYSDAPGFPIFRPDDALRHRPKL